MPHSARNSARTLALALSLAAFLLFSCAPRQAAPPAAAAPEGVAAAPAPAPAPVAEAPQPRGLAEENLPDSGAARKKAGKDAEKVAPKPSGQCFSLRPGGKKARCEPQSLPYGRCRSGIMSCRLGKENGPLTWFACEKKHGNTSDEPAAGGIIILAANARRGMPTGHVAYVEDVKPRGNGQYLLILSHTNYDRKCSLETRVEVLFTRKAMSVDFLTGAWKAWAKDLKVAGFILN